MLSDDVGATAYFPASFTGSTALPPVPAIDSPTWAPVPVGAPAAPQYVTADLFAAAAAAGQSVIVAADSPSSQHAQQQQQQQVPAQPLQVFQPYPQHVSVAAAPLHQQQHPASYLQQPAPAPAHLQVSNFPVCLRLSCNFY